MGAVQHRQQLLLLADALADAQLGQPDNARRYFQQLIDDAPQSLEPLLALHERDRANGLLDAPWPPVYPKQPDEPPRVAPSRARRQE